MKSPTKGRYTPQQIANISDGQKKRNADINARHAIRRHPVGERERLIREWILDMRAAEKLRNE
jgi:hypothetical protein